MFNGLKTKMGFSASAVADLSVPLDVNSKAGPLLERFAAHLTDVGMHAGVHSFMLAQVGQLREPLEAELAREGAFCGVDAQVPPQTRLGEERFAANGARQRWMFDC